MSTVIATREHEIACGHRVVGHEGKCAHLHGHNYLFTFHCEAAPTVAKLDKLGRVVDFSVIKSTLCAWLEENWDHRFIVWTQDEWMPWLRRIDANIVAVPFNPTAERLAQYLVEEVGPRVLPIGVRLVRCDVMETRKCGASFTMSEWRR